jgi:3-hydroxyacyl-CoA dehydrogenase
MADLRSIRKVCVIGAGTMGSGIAAHLTNLGFQVTLLDVSVQSITEAFDRAKVTKPPLFYLHERAMDIRLGNTLENLPWITEADWVCEAIVERLDAKKALYSRIEPYIREDALISTNTSGLQIELLSEGLPDSFASRLVGAHFFNPPRHLKLLELIPTPKTEPALIAEWTEFLESRVARRVVVAKDTPGFIANRYGMWCMYHAIHVAEKLHFTVEQVDAITGPFIGRPKSATFRLNDLVGLDVMEDIAANLMERCPHDIHIQTLKAPASIMALINRNWIGEKSGQGYYRKEGRELLALDLGTFAYRQKVDVDLPSIKHLSTLPLVDRIKAALELKDETGEFLRNYLIPVLKYADYLKEEISHSVLDIDRVMEWGFGWQLGPFATIDAINSEKSTVGPFYQANNVREFDGNYRSVSTPKEYTTLQDYSIVGEGETYRLRDLGDGITAVALTTKMGVISPLTVIELTKLLESGRYERMVLTSEAKSYSAGFDLRFFSQAIADERWIEIDKELAQLQSLGELLEKSNIVTAIFGHALGAGLELALSTSKIVAQVETHIGLPESKVGLLPAGRGLTLMRLYNQFTAKRLSEVTFNVATGAVSNNAEDARALGYLRPTDLTVFHPDRLIYEAKVAALDVTPVDRPKVSTAHGPLSGMIDRLLEIATTKGELSSYDELIGQKMKLVVSKAVSYEDCLAKERTEFLDLCSKALTHARINHMLTNGTALRN